MLTLSDAAVLRDVFLRIRQDSIGLRAAENEIGAELIAISIAYIDEVIAMSEANTECEFLRANKPAEVEKIAWFQESERIHSVEAERFWSQLRKLTEDK